MGWDYDDALEPFAELFGVAREPAGTFYTNREVAALVAPSRLEVPYVWDDLGFERCIAAAA